MMIALSRYRRSACGMLLAALLLAANPAPGRGVAARENGTRPAGQTAPGTLWRFVTGGRQIITAPVVGTDGTLYAASSDGVLYAVSPRGRQLWSLRTGVTTGDVPPARPAVGPGLRNDSRATGEDTSYWNLGGGVVAVTRSGHPRWVFLATGGGSPVLTRGHVLFAAGPYLYAINADGADAGHAAWRAAIGAAGATTGGPSLAVGPDGTAYVPSSDGFLYAIAPNGLRRWAFRAPGPPRGAEPLLFSPTVGPDGTVYLDSFANGHGMLYALTPAGRLRWSLAVPAGSDLARGSDGTVYAATHLLVAVSAHGRVSWQRAVDAAAPPVAAPGHSVLVVTLSPPTLLALGAGGVVRWRLPLPAAAVAPPALNPNGRLYVGDYLGALTALAPGTRGARRTIQGAAPAGPPFDLGAGNPPFIVRSGRTIWRVTLARTVERSVDGGRHWQTIFSPGVSVSDPRSGTYRNARYADVAFLAVDPHDPTGLYAGTVGTLGDYLSGGAGGADGGLYYSPNGATGWRQLNAGLPFTYEPRLRVPTFGLDSLVFDPSRRGVLYVQTPTAFGSPGHDAGLYKSIDGGHHWRAATRGLPAVPQGNALIGAYRAFPPGALLVDRTRPNVLFLVASTGFYRSADAAEHWTRVGGVRYTDPGSVAVRIGAGGVVRVFADRGVYISRDYGAHWRASRQ